MKKSSIFMGISAVVLAVAGIATTRASVKDTLYDYFTHFGVVGACHNGVVVCGTGTHKCTVSITSGATTENATMYTTTNSSCANILNKKA